VNTDGYGGHEMKKDIRVFSNDPAYPEMQLVVGGTVNNFATITPPRVRLYGTVGSPLKQTVTIVPEKSYPFKIIETKASSGRDIRFELREETDATTVKYLLTVENLKDSQGRYFDTIQLTTDSKIKPQIRINVSGRIDPADGQQTN
jgi:hypothetical protein